MKYHKGPQIKTFALCVAAALLAACETLPKADVIESNGCGVLQWNTGWVKANVTEIEWTGVCNSGLISGVGELRAKTKSGGKITYQGRAEYGRFQTRESELATLVFLDEKYVGQFRMGRFYNGKFYKNNQIAEEGYFSDGSLYIGTVYLTNGNRITGTFNNQMGKISSDGAGVAYGTYETAGGQPIWWIVDEKKITTLEKYTEKLREKRLAEKKNIDEQIAKAKQNAIEAEKNYNASVKNTLGALANIAVESGAAVAQRKAEIRQQREQQAAAQQAQKNQQISSSSTNSYTAASPRFNNTNTPPIQHNQSTQHNNYSSGAQGQSTATTVQNLNSCLTIANQTRGDRCNSATSVLIELRNSCSVPIDAVICVEQSDGRARCTTFGNTSPGNAALNTICNGTGRYKYWGCPAGTGTARCSGFHEYYSSIP